MTRELHYQTMAGLANLYLTSERGWTPQEAWDATEGALQDVRREAWEHAVNLLNGHGRYEAAQLLEGVSPYQGEEAMSEQGSRTWLETPAMEESSTWWWKGEEVNPTRQRYLNHLVGPTKGSN